MFNSRTTGSQLPRHVLHLENGEDQWALGKVIKRNSAMTENCLEIGSTVSSTPDIS